MVLFRPLKVVLFHPLFDQKVNVLLPTAATSAKPWVAKSTEGRAPTTLHISRHQVVARREARQGRIASQPLARARTIK